MRSKTHVDRRPAAPHGGTHRRASRKASSNILSDHTVLKEGARQDVRHRSAILEAESRRGPGPYRGTNGSAATSSGLPGALCKRQAALSLRFAGKDSSVHRKERR